MNVYGDYYIKSNDIQKGIDELDGDDYYTEWKNKKGITIPEGCARETISPKLRFEIFKRDGFACVYCGRKPPEITLCVDHIKPVSKGGKTVIFNLATSCTQCNMSKSDIELDDFIFIIDQKYKLDHDSMLHRKNVQDTLKIYEDLQKVYVIELELLCSNFEDLFRMKADDKVEITFAYDVVQNYNYSTVMLAMDFVAKNYKYKNCEAYTIVKAIISVLDSLKSI